MFGTYAIDLWDHEAETWSNSLAAEFIGRPAKGLSHGELSRALRTLYGAGWSNISLYVARED